MKAIMIRLIAGVLALLIVMPATVRPQGAPPPAPVFQPPELDQLLAPVALYPDPLLAQILAAATYPLEVVEAARWVQGPGNAALRGDQLTAALEMQSWDPSVKSLVPFPQILLMMDSRLDWMQKLGDAFLAQQADVMDSIQRLRREAQAAGTLLSTPQQVVTDQGQTVVIEPATPQVIYVPAYDPAVVYGAWPYPAYPPVYIPPPVYGFAPVLVSGIGFGTGVIIVRQLWGWGDWDWRHHRVHVDVDRFNAINGDRRRVEHDTWEHDPVHRRGVGYVDPPTRARFESERESSERARVGPPEARRAFRGNDGDHGAAPPPALPPGPPSTRPPSVPAAPERRPEVVRGDRAATRNLAPAREVPDGRAPNRVVPNRPVVPDRPAPNPSPAQRPAAPAFGGVARGPEIHSQAERGHEGHQGAAPGNGSAATGERRDGDGRGGATQHRRDPAPTRNQAVREQDGPRDH